MPDPYDLDLLRLEHDGRHTQDDFFASAAPYAYFKAGRGCGKTTTLIFDAVDYADTYPESHQLFTEPTFGMVEKVALPALDAMYGKRRGRQIDWTMSPPVEVRMGNGSIIWIVAADSIDENRLRGMNLARLLMDEAASGGQEAAFHLASGCVRDTRYPNARKFTSTPQGRNWLWKMFTEEPLPGAQQYVAYSEDAEHAGFVPEGWVEDRAVEYGGWGAPLARQELLGQELEMAGQVFPQFRRDVHVRAIRTDAAAIQGYSGRGQAEAGSATGGGALAGANGEGRGHSNGQGDFVRRGDHPFKQILGGIDFGGVSPTALVAGGLDGGGRVWAFAEWYKHEATFDQLTEAMARFWEEFGVKQWFADPSGKAEIEKLRNIGFDVVPASHGNKIPLRVQLVGARLNISPETKLPGCYFTPEVPNLIMEIEGLAWRRHRIQGRMDEQLTDNFASGTPDHAF